MEVKKLILENNMGLYTQPGRLKLKWEEPAILANRLLLKK
jgi:hypothetical protein